MIVEERLARMEAMLIGVWCANSPSDKFDADHKARPSSGVGVINVLPGTNDSGGICVIEHPCRL